MANKYRVTRNSISPRQAGKITQCKRWSWSLQMISPHTSQVWKHNAQKTTPQVVEATVGEGVLTDLHHRLGPLDRHDTIGKVEVQGAEEEELITCAAEVEGHAGDTAGAATTRWWRGGERRSYDKGQQEGLWTNVCVPPWSVCVDYSPAPDVTFTIVSYPPVHCHHPGLWYALSYSLMADTDGCCFLLWCYMTWKKLNILWMSRCWFVTGCVRHEWLPRAPPVACGESYNISLRRSLSHR